MKKVTVNPLDSRFTENMKEALSNGYTVVCSQRPLNGLKVWENDTLGNGIYFAYGTLDQFATNWEFLDASVVTIQTNEDVINIIKDICNEEGTTLEEVLQDSTIEELADSLELVYIPVVEDTTSQQWKELYNAIQSNKEVATQQPSEAVIVDPVATVEPTTYYFYNQTFSTYQEACNHALKYNSPVTMIIPSNHPTMQNERLKQLEHDYTFNRVKMAYDDMKEYFAYISTLPVSSDQQERFYRLKDYIQRYEYKQQLKEEEKQLQEELMKQSSIMLDQLKRNGLQIVSKGKDSFSYTDYIFNNVIIHTWHSDRGLSSQEYYEMIKNIHDKCFNKQPITA